MTPSPGGIAEFHPGDSPSVKRFASTPETQPRPGARSSIESSRRSRQVWRGISRRLRSRSATQGRIDLDPQSRLIQPVTVIKGVQSRPRKSSLVPSPPHLPRPINPSHTRINESIRFDSDPQRLSGWSLQPIRHILFRNKHLGTLLPSGPPSASQSTLLVWAPVQFPTPHFFQQAQPRQVLGFPALAGPAHTSVDFFVGRPGAHSPGRIQKESIREGR